ncbi:leukotriene A-4 hydrolase-like [Temnothorax nylanderi]|uniref:leukotriene A-4 hydrolase-like n=1 Tax=Temnothorax nylanderi TaxID=102681 RepID=UPI003A8B6D41
MPEVYFHVKIHHQIESQMDLSPGDPHSHSRLDHVAVTHTRLELSVDFKRHVLEGKAILTIEKKMPTCNELVLDNYKLKIDSVRDLATRKELTKTIVNHDNIFGSKFAITLPKVDHKINEYKIQIKYRTDPESPALYWLKPEQTSDGKHPLLIAEQQAYICQKYISMSRYTIK